MAAACREAVAWEAVRYRADQGVRPTPSPLFTTFEGTDGNDKIAYRGTLSALRRAMGRTKSQPRVLREMRRTAGRTRRARVRA